MMQFYAKKLFIKKNSDSLLLVSQAFILLHAKRKMIAFSIDLKVSLRETRTNSLLFNIIFFARNIYSAILHRNIF